MPVLDRPRSATEMNFGERRDLNPAPDARTRGDLIPYSRAIRALAGYVTQTLRRRGSLLRQ
ncbi:hypothetical protein ACLBWX_01340 [Methylobacterium sp. M6A4_1b]